MDHAAVVADVERILTGLRGDFDEDEPVDEYDHALQSAARAVEDGADDELVVAALLHDIGRSPLVAGAPGVTHEVAAQAWLTPRFGARVGWLAGSHVAAKLHLIDTDPAYAARLSPTSVASARRQHGSDVAGRAGHPWWQDALRLRRYDDAAKTVGAPTPPLASLLGVVGRVAAQHRP